MIAAIIVLFIIVITLIIIIGFRVNWIDGLEDRLEQAEEMLFPNDD